MPWIELPSAAVIVAHRFNPSIVSQLWLVEHQVVGKNDFEADGNLFADVVIQVRSRQFNMLVVPEQLQFSPVVPAGEQQQVVVERLGAFVRALPETPYTGLGLNFTWHLVPPDGDIGRLTRELFFTQAGPVHRHFHEGDAHFGAYFSKDVPDFRLKLDVKPVVIALPAGPENRVQFAFNFHADISQPGAARQIEDRLPRWNELRTLAEEIIDSVERRVQA